MKKGFTLVEVLVSIAVIAIIGTILVAIFSNTLRGSNKSQILAVIKQNGQAVLENMDKVIRSADYVLCPLADDDYLVVEKDGIYTRYRFESDSIRQDNPVKQVVPATGQEETDDAFIMRVCSMTDLMTDDTELKVLTDTNTKTGVKVENGKFIRNRSAGYKDGVTIKFDLKPGIGAPQSVSGQINPVTFQTTVQLR
ncbi:type II secretion system protein [Candidatus Daviesbacteria bacterium]|nr:type II secretion system protein [Candidatus Daviesbacteria bacterium]